MRNRFPGTCYRCGKWVKKGEGHFERGRFGTMRWRVQCATHALERRGVIPSNLVPCSSCGLEVPGPIKDGRGYCPGCVTLRGP